MTPLEIRYMELETWVSATNEWRKDLATAESDIAKCTAKVQEAEETDSPNLWTWKEALLEARLERDNYIIEVRGGEHMVGVVSRMITEAEYEAAFEAGPWC